MLQVTDANFDQEVLKSGIPVVIDCFADWCGPCRMLSPIFEKVSGEMEGKAKFVKLDVDANPTTSGTYEIRSLPTMIIFKDGKEVARHSGVMPPSTLKDWVSGNL